MLERGSGSIINLASVAGSIKGAPEPLRLRQHKAAVIGLTKAVVAADFIDPRRALQRHLPRHGGVAEPA